MIEIIIFIYDDRFLRNKTEIKLLFAKNLAMTEEIRIFTY